MDSLLENYGSSEDEHEEFLQEDEGTLSSSSTYREQKSSILSVLPLPSQECSPSRNMVGSVNAANRMPMKPSNSSIFTSLPAPKSDALTLPSNRKPKKVIIFKRPVIPLPSDSDDDEEDEKEKKRRRDSEFAVQTSWAKSFHEVVPAPKETSSFGAAPLGSGSIRRSMIQSESSLPYSNDNPTENLSVDYPTNSHTQQLGSPEEGYANYGSYAANQVDANDHSNLDGYGIQVAYNVEQSNSDSTTELSFLSDNREMSMFLPKIRGKRQAPTDIVEVKQDDLTKDRPRADKMRLTGIAFGPEYQSQAEIEKVKPSKVHKRKHQIGSLFYDMKQKEMEFAERRARGLLSKAQTQGKYGW